MIALDLLAPVLTWKPAGPPELEQPVNVRLAAIVYPDGTEPSEDEVFNVGVYVYRLGPAGEEMWNETEQRWAEVLADPGELPPLPLVYKNGDPLPWQGMLLANKEQKDKDGEPRFAKNAGGTPRYRLRAYAHLKHDGADYAGLGAPSSELAFVSGAERRRFTVEMTPDEQVPERVCLKLRNAALATAGYLQISTSSGQQLEIANCDASGAKLAAVLLAADGSIHLQPATGKKIVFEGDLEARRIRYQPWAGGGVTDL